MGMAIDSVTKPIEFGQTLAEFNSSNRSGTELVPGAWLVPGYLKFARRVQGRLPSLRLGSRP